MFGVADALLTISSTRIIFYLLYCALNMAMNTLAFVWLFLPPGIFSFPPWSFSRVRAILNNADFSLIFPSPKNKLLLLHGHFSFLHPEGSISFPFHALSLILALESHSSSLPLCFLTASYSHSGCCLSVQWVILRTRWSPLQPNINIKFDT